jgi:hypothetical protein
LPAPRSQQYDIEERRTSELLVPVIIKIIELLGSENFSNDLKQLCVGLCTVLLKRSAKISIQLLSLEIVAICKLTRVLRGNPTDALGIRALKFLKLAFIKFSRNGLFVVLFKGSPADNSPATKDEVKGSADADDADSWDIFFVLQNLMQDLTLSAGGVISPLEAEDTNRHNVFTPEEPILDVIQRLLLFKDINQHQFTSVLKNLSKYLATVYSSMLDYDILTGICFRQGSVR